MDNNDMYFLMKHPSMKHLRKQLDPKYRRGEHLKNECQRVSEPFNRYLQQYHKIIKENQELYARYIKLNRSTSNRSIEYVEAQFNILIGVLLELNKKGDKNKFSYLRNTIFKTLTIELQPLKSAIYHMRYNDKLEEHNISEKDQESTL